MKNYRLRIQYDGTNYSGWQVQPNVPTVQGEIIKAIKIITGTDVNLIGSGRTDSGVHAIGQIANFQTDIKLNIHKFKHSLNSILADDISITELIEVPLEFHSRFDAKKRSYLYLFSKEKSPFYNNYTYQYSPIFDLPISHLNDISKLLLGEQDFTSFSKKNTDTENMICNITLAKWRKVKNQIIFRIDGNRFLHGMVRTIVGTILQIAEKGQFPDELVKIIETKDRNSAGRSVVAKGLFLTDVKY